jgi:hypothetical protein
MKTPLPAINAPPEARPRLLPSEAEAQKYPQVQARSLLQSRHARTRRQGARVLGGRHPPVGRWRAA